PDGLAETVDTRKDLDDVSVAGGVDSFLKGGEISGHHQRLAPSRTSRGVLSDGAGCQKDEDG
ncbi:MAG: hypothetical protein ACRD4T_13605, partial [Candidatus Acidiferrales bacterium]